MTNRVEAHYTGAAGLDAAIRQRLADAGKDVSALTAMDLASVDEFHVRGRIATLELADQMDIKPETHILDIGSGLGGPARTLADYCGCRVTGIDLTAEFCRAATVLSEWVGLADRVAFKQADATELPFDDDAFDAAVTLHVAMNIPEKDRVYREVRRVLKPGSIFGVYDIVQGEGGPVSYPAPWARDPSISHLVTPAELEAFLVDAGFTLLKTKDSTEAGQEWFEEMAARNAQSGPPPVTFQAFLGDDFPTMMKNMVRNLTERRVRTVAFICRA